MRSVNPFALSAYLNFTVLTMSLAGNVAESYMTSLPLIEMLSQLPPVTYILIGLTSVLLILAVVTRFYAVKSLSVSRMSVFMQMGLLVQILVDIFVLGYTFTAVQMVGFTLMLGLYILLFAGICCGGDQGNFDVPSF